MEVLELPNKQEKIVDFAWEPMVCPGLAGCWPWVNGWLRRVGG